KDGIRYRNVTVVQTCALTIFIITATPHHSYNALICTAFLPEYGRMNVFKLDANNVEDTAIVDRVGGRSLCKEEITLNEFNDKINNGFTFTQTTLTEQFDYDEYKKEKDERSVFVYFIKPSGQLYFYATDMRVSPQIGDIIVSLTPPSKKIEEQLNNPSL